MIDFNKHNKTANHLTSCLDEFLFNDFNSSFDTCDCEIIKFRLINKADFNNYEVLKDINYDLGDFKIIIDFYKANTDIILKAYKLFCEIFKD